jgi:hypothetical protein
MFFDDFLIINTIQYRTLPKAAMSVKKVGVQLERCKSMEIYFLEILELLGTYMVINFKTRIINQGQSARKLTRIPR